MRPTRITGAAALTAAAALALALAGCTSETPADTETAAAGALVPFSLATIPGGPTGMAVNMALADGAFEAAGLDVSIEVLESGPAIINGVIADQFDAGWAAVPPVLSAVQGQAGLRLIAGGTMYTVPGPTSMVTLSNSGITDWADLAGKKIGTNAPRSGGSLGILASIANAGGDPASVELIPLPWDQVASSVEGGDIDAGSISAPYNFEALANNTDLVDIGDPFWDAFEDYDEPLLNDMFFTTGTSYDADTDKYEKFAGVLSEYFGKVNDLPIDEYRAAMGEVLSMPEELSALLPGAVISTGEVTAGQLAPYDEAMQAVGWTTGPTDLTAFLGG